MDSTYKQIAQEIAELVEKKQAAYGDSFGKSGEVMKQFYPEGISLDQIPDALTLVRIVDKMFRIATDKDALGEDPYRDITGYGLLAVGRGEIERELKEKQSEIDARAHEIKDSMESLHRDGDERHCTPDQEAYCKANSGPFFGSQCHDCKVLDLKKMEPSDEGKDD